MKFFEGWIKLFSKKNVREDVLNWARIEYKNDAEFAYNHMIAYGRAPEVRVEI